MDTTVLAHRPSADADGALREALAVWVRLPGTALGPHSTGAFHWTLILGNGYPSGRIAALLPSGVSAWALREQAARRLGMVSRLPRLMALQSEVTPPGASAPIVCDVRAVLA